MIGVPTLSLCKVRNANAFVILQILFTNFVSSLVILFALNYNILLAFQEMGRQALLFTMPIMR